MSRPEKSKQIIARIQEKTQRSRYGYRKIDM